MKYISNEFGVKLRGKGPHKPEYVYDIVRKHTLMIYTDLIEYNVVGDTKAPLLRCFLFISKLKSGDIITTGQTFSNLQFRLLLKKSFHSIHIDLRDTSGEKILFVSIVINCFFWCLEKPPTSIFNEKDIARWSLQENYRFFSIEVLVDSVVGDPVLFHQFLGEQQFQFCVIMLSRLQTHWCLLVGICSARNCKSC